MIITIDGPGASGKSSVAQTIARHLGIYYLYTGLLYRAVAYIVAQHRKNHRKAGFFDSCNIGADDLGLVDKIDYHYANGSATISFAKKDITSKLYDVKIDELASIISKNKGVREKLLSVQRSIAQQHDLVADGRDCGTVVFPHAEYKFYLTARIDVRTRRLLECVDRHGNKESLQKLKEMLVARDKRDETRDVAPLKVPKDAIVIDNSDMTLQQTVELFLQHIGKHGASNV